MGAGGRKASEVIVSVWLSTYCRIGAVEGWVRFLVAGVSSAGMGTGSREGVVEWCVVPDVDCHVAWSVLFELGAGGDEVVCFVACDCTYAFVFCCRGLISGRGLVVGVAWVELNACAILP